MARPGATRSQHVFYLSLDERAAIDKVLVAAGMSFSEYVASAVLVEAQRDGAVFFGRVRGSTCGRASPDRDTPCASGQPASWWNRYTLAWVCPPCAATINKLEEGICLPPEKLPGGRVPLPHSAAAISYCPICGVKGPRAGTHEAECPWRDVDGAFDQVQLDPLFKSASKDDV